MQIKKTVDVIKQACLDEYFNIDKFGDDAEFNTKFGHGGNTNPAAGHVSRGAVAVKKASLWTVAVVLFLLSSSSVLASSSLIFGSSITFILYTNYITFHSVVLHNII